MGGGATAAVLTLDTAVDDSRKETAKGVTRFPNRFSSRGGQPCYYHRLECGFFFFSLLSSLLLFVLSIPLFPFISPPSLYRHLPLLRVASSVQQISVLLEYVCFPSIRRSDILASFLFCFISEFVFE